MKLSSIKQVILLFLITLSIFVPCNFLSTQHQTVANNQLENTANSYISSLKAVKRKAQIPVQKETNSEFSLGLGPIYFTSWVKYIHFPRSAREVPKDFFVNTQFAEQFQGSRNLDLNETSKDEIGNSLPKNIPSQFDFYFLIFKDSFIFLKSRESSNLQTYDSLQLEAIDNCPEEMMKNGEETRNKYGIQDYGNFPEGNCIRVLTSLENWIVCTKTLQEKENLFTILLKLKINNQRENYKFISGNDEGSDSTLGSFLNNDHSSKKPNVGLPVNGYWVILQNWSQCSLKCGGGVSTLHRMCIHPKNGGLPCQGQGIMTKPCNVQPCPENDEQNSTTTTLKPIVKIMPFSNKPQKYIKCVIKESDMLYTNNSTSLTNHNEVTTHKQMPVRLIMNENTISIFSGDDSSSRILTFNLESTTFKRILPKDVESQKKENCFILSSGTQVAEMCPLMSTNCQKQIEEWDYDFHLFKNQCRPTRHQSRFDLEGEMTKKIMEAKKQVLELRENSIKEEQLKREAEEQRRIVALANSQALKVLQKEINIEEMLKKEELEKEKQEELELEREIEEQKRKADCVMKAIKEKEIENQFNKNKLQTQTELSTIQSMVKDEVKKRRQKLKEYFAKMRNDSKLRLETLRAKYEEERAKLNDMLVNANKKGNNEKCEKGMNNETERSAYCKASFPEQVQKFQICMSTPDEFCKVCCDNEYGEFHIKEKDKCILDVCLKNRQDIL